MANKKKSKEQVYRGIKGKELSPENYKIPIYDELTDQIKSEYPNIYDSSKHREFFGGGPSEQDKINFANILKSLSDDMQLGKFAVHEDDSTKFKTMPEYMYKGKSYDIDESPKVADPQNILTSLLGELNPFKKEQQLTSEERKNVPVRLDTSFYRNDSIPRIYNEYGKVKDFREGRKGGRELFGEPDYGTNSEDPRKTSASFMDINPQTLDEMISAPGTAKIRFQKLQEQLKQEKQRKDAIESIKDQMLLEEAEKEYGK